MSSIDKFDSFTIIVILFQERRQDALNMKKSANDLYVSSQHKEAIAKYTEALDLCPLCFTEDRAILLSNRAAAKLKLVS